MNLALFYVHQKHERKDNLGHKLSFHCPEILKFYFVVKLKDESNFKSHEFRLHKSYDLLRPLQWVTQYWDF